MKLRDVRWRNSKDGLAIGSKKEKSLGLRREAESIQKCSCLKGKADGFAMATMMKKPARKQ